MRILLFGQTGMLGGYVYSYFRKIYDVLVINRDRFDVDLDKFQKLLSLCDEYEINQDDVIINCVGLLPHVYQSHSMDEQNFRCEILKTFIMVNAVFPHHLEKLSLLYGCKVIHITSDCVFSGKKGNYVETDPFDMFNVYGVSKTSGEPDQICNIRTSIIGHESHKRHLLEWILQQSGKTINGYTNYLWNGVTCLELSKIMHKIIESNGYWKGTRHIYSPDTVSKYELCELVSDVYGLELSVNRYELPTRIDRSLSSIYSNDYNIPSIKSQLIALKDHHHNIIDDSF